MMLPDYMIEPDWIQPFKTSQLQPASYDLRLGHEFSENGSRYDITDGFFKMSPGDFALGHTMETVRIPDDIAARVEGKSSLGRLGLAIHVTAGFIDPGFEGQITLELVNFGHDPVYLYRGTPIGQICFYRLAAPCARPYGHPDLKSHYQHQTGVTESAIDNWL